MKKMLSVTLIVKSMPISTLSPSQLLSGAAMCRQAPFTSVRTTSTMNGTKPRSPNDSNMSRYPLCALGLPQSISALIFQPALLPPLQNAW